MKLPSAPATRAIVLSLALGWAGTSATRVDLVAAPEAQQSAAAVSGDASAYTLLEGLVTLFTGDAGVANGLNAKLDAAAHAPNDNARAGQIGAFVHQVNAQIGKALTPQEAAILIGLAESLI